MIIETDKAFKARFASISVESALVPAFFTTPDEYVRLPKKTKDIAIAIFPEEIREDLARRSYLSRLWKHDPADRGAVLQRRYPDPYRFYYQVSWWVSGLRTKERSRLLTREVLKAITIDREPLIVPYTVLDVEEDISCPVFKESGPMSSQPPSGEDFQHYENTATYFVEGWAFPEEVAQATTIRTVIIEIQAA